MITEKNNGKAALPENMETAYELLGKDAVLIPIPAGTKATRVKGWQSLSLQETQNASYVREFGKLSNVGVVLGKPSNNLCTIDLDSDEALTEFRILNPWTTTTLLTKGRRGGNFWVRVLGDYPKLTKIAGWGEWRSNNGYTVFSGIHPEQQAYSIVQKFRPSEIKFEDIKWPKSVESQFKGKLSDSLSSFSPSSDGFNTESLRPDKLETVTLEPEILGTDNCKPDNCVTLTNQERLSILGNFEECERRLSEWKASVENLSLVHLYETQIERYFKAAPHTRNDFVVNAGARLFYAVSDQVALRLMDAFYQIHASMFRDSLEQHRTEAEAVLVGIDQTYRSRLDANSRALYGGLSGAPRYAFRILGDLAINPKEGEKAGYFFISCRELGSRLGISHPAANRLLRAFAEAGVIEKSIPLKPRGARDANEYRWLLPLTAKPTALNAA